MQSKEIQSSINAIRERMQRHSISKAFIARDEVLSWESDIQDLLDKIQEDGIQVAESYEENGMQFCGSCTQKISLRKMRIDSGMISGLIKCFNFVIQNNVQGFQIQEIDLIPQEYSKLNHLVRFGLLYKQADMKNGEYWVPRKTVSRFLAGEWNVAEFYETDPTKKEWEEWRRVMSEKRISIHEIPSVKELQKQFGDHLTEYLWNEDFE